MTEEKEKKEETVQEVKETANTSVGSPEKRRNNRFKGKKTNTDNNTTRFEGQCSALKGHVFVYSDLNTKKWITSREKFISYAGTAGGGNEQTTLERGQLTIVTAVKPELPTAAKWKAMDEIQKEFYKQEHMSDLKIYKDEVQKTRRNLTKLYTVLWEQCDPLMKNKIKATNEFNEVDEKKCVLGLLAILDTVCENGDAGQNRRLLRFYAKKKVYNFRQSDEMDTGQYLDKFRVLVKIAEKAGARFYEEEDIEDVKKNGTIALRAIPWKHLEDADKEELQEQARQRALAMVFFMNSNDSKYAVLKQEVRNAITDGIDKYPKTITEAHTRLEAYRFNPHLYQLPKRDGQSPQKGSRYSGHNFFMEAEETDVGPDNKPERRKEIPKDWKPQGDYECHNCDRKNQCLSFNCEHLTKENGQPTRNERRRIQAERANEAKGQVDSAQQHMMDTIGSFSDDEESWSAELTGDDYDVSFYMDASVGNVLVEDLRGKSKHAFNQCQRKLNPRWILFDNCSSVNVFYNKRFLKNIRAASKCLHLYTNAGKAIITMVGDLPGFGEVYYYPEGIANILSFHAVTNMDEYTVEYHNGVEDAFKVTNRKGQTRKFIPSPRGLYYWDSTEAIEEATVLTTMGLEEIAVETIKGNKGRFSARDNNTAVKARMLQNITNWSTKDMTRAATYGPLLNSPFSPRDIRVMNAILGPSVAGLQGKSVRKKRKEVKAELIPVPKQIMDYYQDVVLSIDVMHVNSIPFLVTIAKHIHFGSATPLPDMNAETLFGVVSDLDKFYYHRGFKIAMVLADKQFECISADLGGIAIAANIAAQDEHVPEVERFIRVIKERCRSAINNTPFTKIPGRMIIGLIDYVLLYINGLPWEQGVSQVLSPMTIVTGRKLDYNLHCKVPFGSYAQVRRRTDNTMKTRTYGAIAMGPARNLQGAMAFMRLKTGRRIERDRPDYTILPMPDEVIERVNELGSNNPDGLVFGDFNNENDDDEDSSIIEIDEGSEAESSLNEPTQEVDNNDIDEITQESEETTGVDEPTNAGVDDDIEATGVDANEEEEEEEEETIEFEYPEEPDQTDDESEKNNHENEASDDLSEESEPEDGHPKSSVSGRRIQPYSWRGYEDAFVKLTTTKGDLQRGGTKFTSKDLRGKDNSRWNYQVFQHVLPKENNYEVVRSGIEQHNFERTMNFLDNAVEKCYDTISQVVMTQYGLKAGLKVFGNEGKQATNKEMKQMLSREVFEEIEYESLSNEDKRLALPILLFLTRKRDGSIKGRACADGRKQRIWMTKEETRSPTVSTEALFYLLMIDAAEERDVATLDLPGHFLQTPMEGRLILRLDNELALALVELDEKRWKPHLRKIRGRWVIFVKCSKAIYGTLNAALLSYNKLIGHLREWGLTANPYDSCVWNKTINGNQLTVAFHVDDMKVSHKDPSVVDKIIDDLKAIYGKTDPMTVVRGKQHEYLGMTIDFQFRGEVKLTMYDYIQKMINDMPPEMVGEKRTAAPDWLFRTDNEGNAKPLNEELKEYFHTTTARALYLGKRARPDIQTAVAFLCTRVRNPDEYDYKKLKHLMQYLQATRHLPLILGYGDKEVSIYIDGAHAVHADMKGHAGVMVTGGKGTLYAASTKTKLNTISSTETEVVSVGENLPKHIWFRYFRLAQGGNSNEDILYQDNEAAMLLANNGRMSCGKGSRHINIRYFFITDKIRKREIKVEYCPTKEMIADFYTKPLQGSLFTKMRDKILGINEANMWLYEAEYENAMKQFGLNRN